MKKAYDLIVIGAGSGGIAAANRAAQYGARVAVVESDIIGGTCVNVGCVPKKVMWYAADMMHHLHNAADFGYEVDMKGHDWSKLVSNRTNYINRIHQSYKKQFENNKIDYLQGSARLVQNTQSKVVEVEVEQQCYSSDHILIATGGAPDVPEIPGAEYGITSNGFFELKACPESIVIVGSGYIAVELAGMLKALGSEVTLIIRGDVLLRHFDEMLQVELEQALIKQGVKLVKNTQLNRIVKSGDRLEISTEQGEQFTTHALLWAIGRSPNTQSLNLNACGIDTDERGFITVDLYQNTSAENIYAVGDVTGKAALTPVAIAAGRRLSDRIFNQMPDRHLDYSLIPTVVFSHPPIGTVGLTETQAKEQFGDDIKIYTSRFTPMSHAFVEHKVTSSLKLITRGQDEVVVACHVIGPGADEMLQGFAVAINAGVTKKGFDDTVAIHPSSAEELVTMR